MFFGRIVIVASLTTIAITSIVTYFLPCSIRTSTINQSTFDLSRPQAVTYDFKSLSPDILIAVPPSSKWRSEEHFHSTNETCDAILTLTGEWFIQGHTGGGPTSTGPGARFREHPYEYRTWMKEGAPLPPFNPPLRPRPGESASLSFTAPVPYYRTLCSVTQEAERYFSLCETPLWVRSLYTATYLIPFLGAKLREVMVNWALWYQLQVLYETGDFWPYVGMFPFLRFFILTQPKWARDWEIKSMHAFTRWSVRYGSWVGRWLLGMKDRYEQYTQGGFATEMYFKVQGS